MLGDCGVSESREMNIREINEGIPRRVRLDVDAAMPILIFCLLCLGVGAIWSTAFGLYALRQERHRKALSLEGRRATGQITEIYGGRSTDVHYTFRFNGTVYYGNARFHEGRYLDIHPREEVSIDFLPTDPSINHPTNWQWWSWWDVVPQLFVPLVLGLGVAGLVVLYRERRLARIGWVTEGKVIACAPKSGGRFRVDYEFLNEDHELFDGDTEYSLDEYETGSKIRVIYLRKNPKRNDVYPMSVFHDAE